MKDEENSAETNIEEDDIELAELDVTEDEKENGNEFEDNLEFEEEPGEKDALVAKTQKDSETIKKQSEKENAEFARRRRSAEKDEASKKAYNKAVIDLNNNKNPYTGEAMIDDHDVKQFLEMKEIEKNGGDPIADYATFVKKKAKEEIETKTVDEFFDKDRDEFISTNPNVDLSKLISDVKFQKFAGARIGKESLQNIYNDYIEVLGMFEQKAESNAKKIIAKQQASPGSLRTPGESAIIDFDKMSSNEFSVYLEKARNGELKGKKI